MRYINNKYYYVIVACIMGVCMLFSCSNDDEVINEWTANYVYLQKDNYLAIDAFSLSHDPTGVKGEFAYTFSAKIKHPEAKDITVMIEASSDEIPVDHVSFSAKQVTIKAGETSSEYVTATITDWAFAAQEKDEKVYEFSISISDIQTNAKDLRISNNQKTKLIKITKAAFSPVLRTMPADWQAVDRSGWIASSSDYYDTPNVAEAAIDGDLNTTWFSYGTDYDENGESWLHITLDKPINMVGFSITRDNLYGGYSVREATIQIKKEGSTSWVDDEDIFQFGSFDSAPQYAILNSTIEDVMEFRINILSRTDFVGISELNLYTNK